MFSLEEDSFELEEHELLKGTDIPHDVQVVKRSHGESPDHLVTKETKANHSKPDSEMCPPATSSSGMFQLEDSFDDDLDLDLALSASKVEMCRNNPVLSARISTSSGASTDIGNLLPNNEHTSHTDFKVPQDTPKRKSMGKDVGNIQQKIHINPSMNICLSSLSETKSNVPVQTTTNGLNFSRQLDHQLGNNSCTDSPTHTRTRSEMQTPVMNRSISRLPNKATPSNSEWSTPGSVRQVETPSSSSSTSSSGRKKRKFPGPAGLLPRLQPGTTFDNVPVVETTPLRRPKPAEPAPVTDLPLSQSTEDWFKEGPWIQMEKDLSPQAGKVLKQFCVASVLRKAGRKLLPKGKVPAMGVIIETITTQNPDAKVMLKDRSGSIGGTIHRQLVKENPEQFQQGTVLLLRQIGVFSPSQKTHYLNITPNNLVKIYNKGDTNIICSELGHFTTEDLNPAITNQNQESPKLRRISNDRFNKGLFQTDRLFSCSGEHLKNNKINGVQVEPNNNLNFACKTGPRDTFMTPQRDRTLLSDMNRNITSTGSPNVLNDSTGSAKKFNFRKTSSPNVGRIPSNIQVVSERGSMVTTQQMATLPGSGSLNSTKVRNSVQSAPKLAPPAEPMWDDDLDDVLSQMGDGLL